MNSTVNFDNWNTIKKSLETRKVSKLLYPQESEVWMCAWGKNIGYEENGSGESFSRPSVVMKKLNNQMFLVLPLSTKQKKFDFYYNFSDLNGSNVSAIIAQVRLMSVNRFKRKLYELKLSDFIKMQAHLHAIIVPEVKSKPRIKRGISEPEGTL